MSNGIHYEKEHPLAYKFFPLETLNTYAEVLIKKTDYTLLFADMQNKLQKHILKRANEADKVTVKALVYVNKAKEEACADYRLILIFNDKYEDIPIDFLEVKGKELNSEGIIEHIIDISKLPCPLENKVDAYYMILERSDADKKKYEEVRQYPPKYGKNLDNDSNLIMLEAIDYTAEKIAAERKEAL